MPKNKREGVLASRAFYGLFIFRWLSLYSARLAQHSRAKRDAWSERVTSLPIRIYQPRCTSLPVHAELNFVSISSCGQAQGVFSLCGASLWALPLIKAFVETGRNIIQKNESNNSQHSRPFRCFCVNTVKCNQSVFTPVNKTQMY